MTRRVRYVGNTRPVTGLIKQKKYEEVEKDEICDMDEDSAADAGSDKDND
jgi:hypothetical protein